MQRLSFLLMKAFDLTRFMVGWLLGLIPARPSVVLDVGAGIGRDAAWLTSLEHEVIAVEPAAAMREEEQRLHSSARIRWMDNRLPAL